MKRRHFQTEGQVCRYANRRTAKQTEMKTPFHPTPKDRGKGGRLAELAIKSTPQAYVLIRDRHLLFLNIITFRCLYCCIVPVITSTHTLCVWQFWSSLTIAAHYYVSHLLMTYKTRPPSQAVVCIQVGFNATHTCMLLVYPNMHHTTSYWAQTVTLLSRYKRPSA
jgi:hypothetical protein